MQNKSRKCDLLGKKVFSGDGREIGSLVSIKDGVLQIEKRWLGIGPKLRRRRIRLSHIESVDRNTVTLKSQHGSNWQIICPDDDRLDRFASSYFTF